jgi:hypothetical protein
MRNPKLDRLVLQLENYSECWKQFNRYLNQARLKRFDPEDETQFLEVKTVLTQELEMIMAAVDCTSPAREDVLGLIGNAPSLRYLSELSEGNLRGMENQWHKIYIAWQSLLGQLKVQQRQLDSRSRLSTLFSREKA